MIIRPPTHREQHNIKAHRNRKLLAVFLLLNVLIFGYFIFNLMQQVPFSSLTGFTTAKETINFTYTDIIGREATEPAAFTWTPAYSCTLKGCEISSIKIDGKLTANSSGVVRVLLEDKNKQYTIFNKTIELIAKNVTNVTLVYENVTLINESTNETIIKEVNMTREINSTVIEPIEFSFTDACVDSCILTDNFGNETYTISVQLDSGITAKIDSIRYTWTAEKKVKEPAPTENVTNVTVIPANLTNATEVTTTLLTNKTLEWSYTTDADWTGREETGLKIHGKQGFIILANSSEFTLQNNTVTIEARIKIGPETYGTIVSKYDWLNGKLLQLTAEAEGAISLTASDSSSTTVAETAQAFKDNKFHTIKATLNETTAQVYIDGLLAAEEDASQLGDISSNAPIAIGANIGEQQWIGEAQQPFDGEIKHVKVSTK